MDIKSYALTASKYAIGIAVAALPLQALAIDLTPDSDRIISDPLYLPLQGQFYGSSAYTYGRATSETYKTTTGVEKYSTSAGNNTATQLFEYGILDDLAVSVSESYDWNKSDDDYPVSTNNKSSRTDGWVDPTFAVTWRALDQKQYPVTVDFRAAYLPNWMPAKSDDAAGGGGTVASGGQTGTFTAYLGYETRDFTIEALAGTAYHDTRNTLSLNTYDTTDGSSYWDYDIGFNTQTRLTDQFSFNLGVTETFNNHYTITNQTTLISDNYTPGDETAVNVALNYTIIPNHLVAELTYTFDDYSNSSSNYLVAGSDTTIQSRYSNIFGARLQYAY